MRRERKSDNPLPRAPAWPLSLRVFAEAQKAHAAWRTRAFRSLAGQRLGTADDGGCPHPRHSVRAGGRRPANQERPQGHRLRHLVCRRSAPGSNATAAVGCFSEAGSGKQLFLVRPREQALTGTDGQPHPGREQVIDNLSCTLPILAEQSLVRLDYQPQGRAGRNFSGPCLFQRSALVDDRHVPSMVGASDHCTLAQMLSGASSEGCLHFELSPCLDLAQDVSSAQATEETEGIEAYPSRPASISSLT